jgi:hypothetical protein
MAAAGGSRDDPGMDPLSLVPALASLVVVPVALGLAFRWLAGDEADDAISPLSALLMTETQTRPVRGAQDADFVPWRFDTPRAGKAPVDPVRGRPLVTRPSPATPS